MNIDIAAKLSVLRRGGFTFNSLYDGIVLHSGNQSVAQAALGVFNIRITDTKRQVVCTLVIFRKDIELTLRSRAISLALFVIDRVQAQPHLVSADQRSIEYSFNSRLLFRTTMRGSRSGSFKASLR